jgi:hypothetical protein
MANVPSSQILVTLMMEALRSSETLVHTRATLHKIPNDGILHASLNITEVNLITFYAASL